MQIEYITHASLFLTSPKVRLLTDPFFFLDKLTASFMCHFPARDLTPDYFGKIDFVYCSHIHDDHCHKETMLALKDCINTIILPARKPLLEKKIRSYGFENFISLNPFETTQISPDLKLTCYEDPGGVDTALVIQLDQKTVLHQNDCRLTPKLFAEMAQRFKIDYAFFPHTGNQELYPLLLPRTDDEWLKLSKIRENTDVQTLVDSLSILKPKVVIPYSFTVMYHNTDQISLNAYNRTTPVEFKSRLKESAPQLDCLIMQPGDILDTITSNLIPQSQTNFWGNNLNEYMQNFHTFTANNFDQKYTYNFGEVEDIDSDLKKYFEERLKLHIPNFFGNQTVALHILGNRSKKTYYIDTGKKVITEKSSPFPFLEITMPATVVDAFLSRKYDSFMILYSYRITFKLNIFLALNDRQECDFFIAATMALFDYELYMTELT